MSISEELRQAAARLRATADNGYSEPLANWFDHTADNMLDERAYEVTFVRVDASSYTQVHIDGNSHTGLSSEWTAALELARRINAVNMSKVAEASSEPVSDGRVKEILDRLNGMVVDQNNLNLDEAVEWALWQPNVVTVYGPQDGEAEVEMADGKVLKWMAPARQWVVTVSEDTDVEVSR
jgi:hypothetical protein